MNLDKIVRTEINKFILEQQDKQSIKNFFDKAGVGQKTYTGKSSEYKDQQYYQITADNNQTVRFYIGMKNKPAFRWIPARDGINYRSKGTWKPIEYVYNPFANNITVTYNGQPYTIDTPSRGRVTMRLTNPTETYLDWFQTAMDWLGFIPGWGDLIDVFNAALYFGRGKYLDGALSVIAVIPAAGSVISASLKTFFKVTPDAAPKLISAFKGKSSKQLSEVWNAAINDGYVDRKTLNALSDALDPIAQQILSKKDILKKYTPEQYHAQVDYIADHVKLFNDSLLPPASGAKLSGQAATAAAKSTLKISGSPIKFVTGLAKFTTTSTFKTMFKYIKSADDVIVNIFRKKLENSPELVYASLKFALDAVPGFAKKLPADFVNKINLPDAVTYIRDLSKNKPNIYKDLAVLLTTDDFLLTNVHFKAFAKNTIVRWKAAGSPTWRATIGNIRPIWIRWLDIGSNEVQELFDIWNDYSDEKINTRDEQTAVLIPIIEYIFFAMYDDRDIIKNWYDKTYSAAEDKVVDTVIDRFVKQLY
jgi:hypothetical protein